MSNPIPKTGMWVTPTSLEDLTVRLDNIGSVEEQRMAWNGAIMALNWAHMAWELAESQQPVEA
jgi:hypothetical protein